MFPESQEYILSLCSDPNVWEAEMYEEDGKTYITISAHDGEDYGYDGRVSTWKMPANIRVAVNQLIKRLNKAA